MGKDFPLGSGMTCEDISKTYVLKGHSKVWDTLFISP